VNREFSSNVPGLGLLNALRGGLKGALRARVKVLFRCVSATRPK